MYSNKASVNILTSLLVAHGVKHVVVCPGSRNSPLVHNFYVCPDLKCFPVTDERSAGFYALGMAIATDGPVAICVTSGTALLNVAPAVAEASYQHRRLIVISADRPQAWIDQLDGQTMPQVNAFGVFVSKCVNLPEVNDDESRWLCNRLINEAFVSSMKCGGKPVHINVPISEPLFDFNVLELPKERKIEYIVPDNNIDEIEINQFLNSKRPIIVIGQMRYDSEMSGMIDEIRKNYVVLCEPLAYDGGATWFDKMYDTVSTDASYAPDHILYMGDTVVSKLLKRYVRSLSCTDVCMISEDGEIHDVTMRMNRLVACSAKDILKAILKHKSIAAERSFYELWNNETEKCRSEILPISSKDILKETARLFEVEHEKRPKTHHVHYANSSSVRYGCLFSNHYIYVNRGINGIEGSLSTAAGYSLMVQSKTFIVIGDLSFFYDSNALWNKNLNGNLRILLMNNGCGGIFSKLKGLENSPSRDDCVAASHETSAEGLCKSYGIDYMSASDIDDVKACLPVLFDKESDVPILLEVKEKKNF